MAAQALKSLASNDCSKVSIAAAGAIPALVEIAKNGTDVAKEAAAGALKLLKDADNEAVRNEPVKRRRRR